MSNPSCQTLDGMNWRLGLLVGLRPALGYLAIAEALYWLYVWGLRNSDAAVLFGGLLSGLLAYPGIQIADALHIYDLPTYFGQLSWADRPLPNHSLSQVAFITTAFILHVGTGLPVALFAAQRSKRKGM